LENLSLFYKLPFDIFTFIHSLNFKEYYNYIIMEFFIFFLGIKSCIVQFIFSCISFFFSISIFDLISFLLNVEEKTQNFFFNIYLYKGSSILLIFFPSEIFNFLLSIKNFCKTFFSKTLPFFFFNTNLRFNDVHF
jgi:hypothetical protein